MVVVLMGALVVSRDPDWLRRLFLVVVLVVLPFPPRPREPLIRSIRPAFFVEVTPRLVVVFGLRVVVFFDPGLLVVVARPAGFFGQTFSCLQVTPSWEFAFSSVPSDFSHHTWNALACQLEVLAVVRELCSAQIFRSYH